MGYATCSQCGARSYVRRTARGFDMEYDGQGTFTCAWLKDQLAAGKRGLNLGDCPNIQEAEKFEAHRLSRR